ncbi:MAG: hypothetical protein KDK39_14225 [Leptospiraceae bacterium]|nr:hypothetical protein [Leptospiraceae bacterium]
MQANSSIIRVNAHWNRLVFLVLLAGIAAPLTANSPWKGRAAPDFKVVSGNDRVATLKQFRGQILVIMYESGDSWQKNRALKRALLKLYNEAAPAQRLKIGRLPVIDCRKAVWPITNIYKQKLVEHSMQEGLTIFGDWDGNLLRQLSLQSDQSNLVIIDQAGIVRYHRSGVIPAAGITAVQNLMRQLLAGMS